MAQHVSGDTQGIIRSSKTVIAVSGFTYVFGCRPLRWVRHRRGSRIGAGLEETNCYSLLYLLLSCFNSSVWLQYNEWFDNSMI